MNEKEIFNRANNKCELCESDNNLSIYEVFKSDNNDGYVVLCETCRNQIESENYDESHFNCLNNAMWSEVPAVKILSYKILNILGRNDLTDMMYLTDEEMAIANKKEEKILDANGNELKNGDNVTVIKDLDVKGAGKTIKRGTVIKNIRMCDVPGHVSCRVDGIGQVYLKAEFLSPSN
ncbi:MULTISPECIES: PhnA domain-containing protein [unclassified Lebetimonas]|uniref:PhnA domain-containing protein n=1 Tax=unclassified Lebetimonas TaxID=2648158 RepID=UPI0004644891|nr:MULTISPECIES: alkylphosphonate utilization protein [unclassified Lebetimonas]